MYSIRCLLIATAKIQKIIGILGYFGRKYYFCSVKERISWIDWGKTVAVTTVVFCHLPQSQEWFYYRYLQSAIIVVFFFLSGYLKRDRGSRRANWRKYWWGLVLPYLLYNLLVYPYWLVKFYVQHQAWPTLLEAMRPIVGTLLLQHEGAFAEPLNGPLWYLPAILLMHLSVDLCRRSRHEHRWLVALCVVSFVLYAANKYWYFAPNLTPMGLMRNLPYYYLGYLFGQRGWFRSVRASRDALVCAASLVVSVLLFYWHLQAFWAGQHLLHIVLFYPFNVALLFAVLCGSKLLSGYTPEWVVNLSVGTLVVIGLHVPVISAVNLCLERLLGISGVICYQWYEALPTALLIVAALYPLIVLVKRRFPALIGKNSPWS